MERFQFKKAQTPDFNNPTTQISFVEEAKNNKELLLKELIVNEAEQNLLQKRVRALKEFINDLPASDPQYSMLVVQLQMDQIELDELKIRESTISEKLNAK